MQQVRKEMSHVTEVWSRPSVVNLTWEQTLALGDALSVESNRMY